MGTKKISTSSSRKSMAIRRMLIRLKIDVKKQNTADSYPAYQFVRALKISEHGEEVERAIKLLIGSYRLNIQFKRLLLVADAHTEKNWTFSELDAITTKLIERLPESSDPHIMVQLKILRL